MGSWLQIHKQLCTPEDSATAQFGFGSVTSTICQAFWEQSLLHVYWVICVQTSVPPRNAGGACEQTVAAAAKLPHSCPTLCDSTDGSPSASPVPGILQARTLEWVAIAFSNAWKWKWKWSCSVMSNSSRPHGLQPTRLLHSWDFPGKSTGVGCHCLLRLHPLNVVYEPMEVGLPNWGMILKGPINWALAYPSHSPRTVLLIKFSSVQFSSFTQSCLTLCNPMNCSMPGLPVHHQLPEFTQTHVHRVGDAIQPSHPLLPTSHRVPSPSQHQGLFQWVNSSHEVAKVLEFQL